MEPTKTIELPLQELKRQKPIEKTSNVLEFYPNNLRYVAEFEAEEPQMDDEGEDNMTLPWAAKPNYYDWTIFKKAITGVTVEYDKWNGLFKVVIHVKGYGSDPTFYFKSKVKAIKLREELIEWINLN